MFRVGFRDGPEGVWAETVSSWPSRREAQLFADTVNAAWPFAAACVVGY